MAMLLIVATTEATGQHTISKNRQRLGVLLGLRNLGCGSSDKEVNEHGS
jgi:hypothetical protein